MRIHRLSTSLVAVCCAVGVLGCGPDRLDTGKLETKIKAGIEQQAGVRIKSVSCPSNVTIKAGDTFDCKLQTTGGDSATVRVTQRDDKGNVRYRVGS